MDEMNHHTKNDHRDHNRHPRTDRSAATMSMEEHAHRHGNQQGTHREGANHRGHEQLFRRRFWISLLLSIPVLIYSPTIQAWLGFRPPSFVASNWITPAFSIIIFFYGGLPFLRMALPELHKRQPGMMTLISLAITVAFVYSLTSLFMQGGTGFFWELVTLIDVMLLGHWLEMRSVRQASRALDELAKWMPDTAELLLPDGGTAEIPVDQLKKDDLVLIRPGASIPVDGIVVQGESDVNEAMITGESKPVSKSSGEEVIAGTINGEGSLRVKVSATGGETALAGIMRLVKEAQESKSRTQLMADRAAGWLFYAALAVAAITALAWTAAIGFQVEVIKRVATVLVIACPHALGLAIPLVVAITTSIGAKNGILVRDRLALEKARLMDVVLFDKTGTLTRGEFGVVDVAAVNGWDQSEALAMAAAVEGDSEHTIAQAFRRTAEEYNGPLPQVSEFEAIKGRGVQAQYADHKIYVGGPRLLETLKLELPDTLIPFRDRADEKGQTVVYLIQDAKIIAAFALADIIRDESRSAVDQLHAMGMQVAMLTGDSEAVARSVAAALDIDQYFAEVLPEHKDRKVKDLQDLGHRVAMVGDGVNDAPALTRADVGIAIGSGTDVAIESAGIILVRNNPQDVVRVVGLSKASHRKMIQNLWWAIGYNIIALPLAAGILAPIGVLLSPAVGAILMSLSTIIVAINAQLLRGTQAMA